MTSASSRWTLALRSRTASVSGTGIRAAGGTADTLVIETTHFTGKTNFRGSGDNLHLVERLTRVDADTIDYRFTVTDPTTWTRPWIARIPLNRNAGPLYEYACHEGNDGLAGILEVNRNIEKTEDAR